MAVKIVDDSFIFGLLAGELDNRSGLPDALVYETAVNAVRGIRGGQSRWPVDTSFSQQNFFVELDGSIWNHADYAKYVERRIRMPSTTTCGRTSGACCHRRRRWC